MELEILGSWAGSPGAREACSGYLISEGDTNVLFDCGPGVVPVLQENHDPTDVSAIFISHMHADHALDLLAYAYRLIRFSWRNVGPILRRPIPLYLPPGGLQVVEHMVMAFGRAGNGRLANPSTSAFEPVELRAEQPVFLGELAIIPYEVQHAVPAFGYRVEGASASFGYSGDTSLCAGLTKLAEGVNLFLCEATAREEGPLTLSAGHLTARQAAEVASEANAQVLVLTHLSRQDPEWVAGLLEDAHDAFDGSLGVASTHLRLSVPDMPYVPLRPPRPMLVEP